MDDMPIIAHYGGVGLHEFQSEQRLHAIVIPELDAVNALDADAALIGWAADVSRSPESRLLAARRLLQPAAEREQRRFKQTFDVQKVRATVTGLGVLRRAHPGFYCSIFDPVPPPGEGRQPARRPPEAAKALRAAQERLA